MGRDLLSVGLDVGTSTTQMVVSRLQVENQASGFTVPKMQITGRQILYESPIHFTPLRSSTLVDGAALGKLIEKEYAAAGITREQVDTGAVIITGETSRKENARAVLTALAGDAGDFVVATAGPDLESVLAARGSGAVDYSEQTGKTLLHMDIGGGTSNLALIREGKVVSTGCLNVGGRLLKRDRQGRVTYVSPVLQGLTELAVGDIPDPQQLLDLARMLTRALEMVAGRIPVTPLLEALYTREAAALIPPPDGAVISFSGGVGACIAGEHPDNAFGDIGPLLGKAIRESSLCRGEYRVWDNSIRATVIGAGCHSVQLSGSTVFASGTDLPLKNLPVALFSREEQEETALTEQIRQRLRQLDSPRAALFLPGYPAASYGQITALGDKILAGCAGSTALCVVTQADMAKALGQYLRLHQQTTRPVLCLDGLTVQEGSYLDVGEPVGPALPVVIKTLVLPQIKGTEKELL